MKLSLSILLLLLVLLGPVSCRVHNSPPELISLSFPEAKVGAEITLSGYQFGSDPQVVVGVGTATTNATVSRKDDNSITIRVPYVAPGPTQIRVVTDEGSSDPLPFIVLQPEPILTSITPENALPGTLIELRGDFLNQVQRVRFDDVEATIRDSSTAQRLIILIPANLKRGPTTLVIETVGGVTNGNFIVAGTPQITSLSAKQTRPGAELIIRGVNLTDGIVRVNGTPTDRSQTVVKDTEIRTLVPTFASSGRVTVTVFEKLVATSADSLQVIQAPAVTNLSARDGIAGDKIILTGLNLRDVTSVSFGSTPVTFRVLGTTQLEATVPSLPAPVQLTVSVSSVGGNGSAADPFFYYVAPGAITVSPGRQLAGRPITINGQNLYRITDVKVSGQSVPITDRTEGTQILVNVPANVNSGPVTVINRAGSTASAPLVVIQKPVISAIVPEKARPGERVIIRGDYLQDARIVFNGSTAAATDAGKNEDTERWVLVPSDAQTGPIQITNVTNQTTASESFTVLRLVPNVEFSPKTGKEGDEIILTGQNLASVQEVRFSNGLSTPARFSLVGATLRVIVPTGAATGQICVTNEAGKSCSTTTFTVVKL